MVTRMHYGKYVDSEVPTTGVFSVNNLAWINEDADQGIDVDFEEHCRECPAEYHDECWGDSTGSTYLIGFVYNEDTQHYEEDAAAEYCAIVNESTVQVTCSKYGIRCALCSPCYPGQGDADSPGEYLCYSVPPAVVGDIDEELKTRIFEIA